MKTPDEPVNHNPPMFRENAAKLEYFAARYRDLAEKMNLLGLSVVSVSSSKSFKRGMDAIAAALSAATNALDNGVRDRAIPDDLSEHPPKPKSRLASRDAAKVIGAANPVPVEKPDSTKKKASK